MHHVWGFEWCEYFVVWDLKPPQGVRLDLCWETLLGTFHTQLDSHCQFVWWHVSRVMPGTQGSEIIFSLTRMEADFPLVRILTCCFHRLSHRSKWDPDHQWNRSNSTFAERNAMGLDLSLRFSTFLELSSRFLLSHVSPLLLLSMKQPFLSARFPYVHKNNLSSRLPLHHPCSEAFHGWLSFSRRFPVKCGFLWLCRWCTLLKSQFQSEMVKCDLQLEKLD